MTMTDCASRSAGAIRSVLEEKLRESAQTQDYPELRASAGIKVFVVSANDSAAAAIEWIRVDISATGIAAQLITGAEITAEEAIVLREERGALTVARFLPLLASANAGSGLATHVSAGATVV